MSKDMRRDLKILSFYLIFSQLPLVFLFLILYLLLFTDKPLDLRAYIARHS